MKRAALIFFVAQTLTRGAEPTPAAPTWAGDVAPILYRSCVECHQPGQIAPFSLLSYTDAAKRAEFIAKAVQARAMPPWLPDGPAGAFLAERKLSTAEIETLTRWAAAGAPMGDTKLAPTPPSAKGQSWMLGQPDLIVRMRQPYPVSPGPADSYEVFPVRFSVAEVPADVLAKARIPESEVLGVAAVEIHPGNNRVLHHADVWIDLTGAAREREAAEGGNGFSSFGTPGFPPAVYLGGRVPGMTPRFLPPGIATSVLPLGGDVVFQIHYRATGKPEVDQSEVGIFLMREPVKRIMDSVMLRSLALDIPAGAADFTVEDTLEIPADCILMSVLPHMHLIAREVHASLVNADGSTQPLLDISRWNFKWQDRYVYREPIFLKKGARVRCRWVFDNSAANKRNPFSPPRAIQFGPNATDEMCSLLLGLVPVNLDDAPVFAAFREKRLREKIAELTPQQRARHNWDEALDR